MTLSSRLSLEKLLISLRQVKEDLYSKSLLNTIKLSKLPEKEEIST
jgi:hypothetical protein